ncbi:hypothetical protein [Nocardioides solisilvae]|uniref:hypothetical protein n=1 Tax=Nocardioides solisilvae TaxID=1542435 RepID=UPI000D74AFBC|nr:hypothetical protein [Nocardioides solisilvae]
MPTDHFAELLALQCGVVSRRQALEAGLQPHDLRRLERRRELTCLLPRVYVAHTGEPTWVQRAWAGVLFAWPGALCDGSALRVPDGPGRRTHDPAVIHVAVERERDLDLPPGLRLHRVADLTPKVQWNLAPPRMRTEYAVLRAGWADLDRLPRRRFIAQVLDDVADGACSVLEHGYVHRVERPHGLPSAGRQVRESLRGPVYRDVEYRAQGVLVEIDGRLFHDSAAARHRDLERDLDAAVTGRVTVRLGWGQVFGTPCRTADRVAALLTARGWTGTPRSCPDC